MTWINAAAGATSFRSMYRLACNLADHEATPRDTRRAARRVVRLLRNVIDDPIADAAILARATLRFQELVETLASEQPGQGNARRAPRLRLANRLARTG